MPRNAPRGHAVRSVRDKMQIDVCSRNDVERGDNINP